MNIISKILSNYSYENAGVRTNLYRILNTGKLANTGKLMILPVDQGFEHGPDRSFIKNLEAYDPDYHFQLAIEGGFSAYAAPLGMLECSVDKFCGQVPLILKMNSSNSLLPSISKNDQAITASIEDALKLGCSAIGFTIYPGSSSSIEMFEEIRQLSLEAKSLGLATVVWSYARGEELAKEMETSLDVISYSAHMAAMLGANIIKVKPPFNSDENGNALVLDKKNNSQLLNIKSLEERIKIVKRACFNGKRLVVFSGGETKTEEDLLNQIKVIAHGGADGSIVGRNMFQRQKNEALKLASKIVEIYKNV